MNESVDLRLKNANHQRIAMLALEHRRILQEVLKKLKAKAKPDQLEGMAR